MCDDPAKVDAHAPPMRLIAIDGCGGPEVAQVVLPWLRLGAQIIWR